MEPITRQELFLAAASGENVELPEPITREEMYLKAIVESGGGGRKKTMGVYSVTDYGVIANDTTKAAENKTALEALVNRVPNNSVIYFPTGQYTMELYVRSVLDKNIVFMGVDSKSSIINFKCLDNSGYIGGGFTLIGDSEVKPSVTFKNLGMRYDIADGDILPANLGSLIAMVDYYTDVVVDDVYMYVGGEASTLPNYNLLYATCDARNIIVRNSKFELFTNHHEGGCVWCQPECLRSNNNPSWYTIDNVLIENNDVKTTCNDEAIAVWTELGVAKGVHERGVFNNVTIRNNSIVQDDFNGICETTSNLISIFDGFDDEIPSVNCQIYNNRLAVNRCKGCVIKFKNLSGFSTHDNDIVVNEKGDAPSSEQQIAFFRLIDTGKVSIKNNRMVSNLTRANNKYIITSVGGDDCEYVGNYIETHGTFNLFANESHEYTADVWCNFTDNVLKMPTDDYRDRLMMQLMSNGDQYFHFNFLRNIITTSKTHYTQFGNASVSFIDNVFNDGISNSGWNSWDWNFNAATKLEWKNNQHVHINFNGTPTSANKITEFVYEGTKNGIRFDGASVDTPAIRAKFFNKSTIHYLDNPLPDVPSTDGTYTLQATVSDGVASYSWV